MPRFFFNVVVRIDVNAEDEGQAQKLAWGLIMRRIDAQQYMLDNNEGAQVGDWKWQNRPQATEFAETNDQEQPQQQRAQNQQNEQQEDGKSKRGFAAMDPEKRREIARKGGEASGGGNRGGGSGDEQLKAMQQFLESHDLPPQGRKDVEEAIEKRKEEVEREAAQQQH